MYEGTVGSLWETNESGLFCDGFVFVPQFCSDPIIYELHSENKIDLTHVYCKYDPK